MIGADVWLEPEGSDRAPTRLLLLVQNRTGYLNLCELLTRCWLGPATQAQPWTTWAALTELNGGLIALSGAELGVVGQALVAGDTARARILALRFARSLPEPLLPRAAARRPAGPGSPGASRRCDWPHRCSLPVVATHPVQFLTQRRLRGARGPGLRGRRRNADQPQASHQALQRAAVLQDAGSRWKRSSRMCQVRWQNSGRDCQALQPQSRARQAAAAQLPDAAEVDGQPHAARSVFPPARRMRVSANG
jgi:hypothetical protein